MEYCGVCMDRATDEDVVAYTEGRSHTVPSMQDAALVYAVSSRRRTLFSKLMDDQDPSVLAWPEFEKMRQEVEGRIVTSMRPNFEKLAEKLPEFSKLTSTCAPKYKKRKKAVRRKDRQLWKRKIIQKFVREDDAAIIKMLDACGWNIPAPLKLIEQCSQPLKLAA